VGCGKLRSPAVKSFGKIIVGLLITLALLQPLTLVSVAGAGEVDSHRGVSYYLSQQCPCSKNHN